MPRTDRRKKHEIELCRACAYELRPEHDGRCPMCARFEQLRIDYTVPRPSDLAAHRPAVRDADGSSAPDAWPPTVAEYRAILAERRVRSTDAGGQPPGMVLRTPGLAQPRLPSPPEQAAEPPVEIASPPRPSPPENEPSEAAPRKARERKGRAGGRRAARPRAPSAAPANKTLPTRDSTAAPAPADVPAADRPVAPVVGPEKTTVVAVAANLALPPRPARSIQEASVVRRLMSHLRAAAGGPPLASLAVVAAGAFIGGVVTFLLSPR